MGIDLTLRIVCRGQPFVEEVEVLDAELKARFGVYAESNVVHEEVVEGGQDLDCEQNQTLWTRRLWKQRSDA